MVRVLRVYIHIKVTSCFAQVIDPLSYGNHANSVLHTVLSTGVCDVASLNIKPQRHQLTKVNVVTGITIMLRPTVGIPWLNVGAATSCL